MVVADYVILALILAFLVLGFFLGFGRGLRFFTKGIFGFIISIFICYMFGGIIYNIGFVQQLLAMFITTLANKGGFCDILLAIRIDIIVYYIVLFIVVQILRILIVLIVSKTFEIENAFVKALNRVFGAIFFLVVLTFFVLLVFQIVLLIGGSTKDDFANSLEGSVLQLKWLFEHNPLKDIVEFFTFTVKAS